MTEREGRTQTSAARDDDAPPAAVTIDPITVTMRGASQASGLGETSLREAIRDGNLESRMVKGRRLVVYASLKALLIGGTHDPKARIKNPPRQPSSAERALERAKNASAAASAAARTRRTLGKKRRSPSTADRPEAG